MKYLFVTGEWRDRKKAEWMSEGWLLDGNFKQAKNSKQYSKVTEKQWKRVFYKIRC